MSVARKKYLESFLPSPAQELLLKAALLEGKEAFDCWKAYLNQVPFDDTDYACSRLLPLVYRNLQSQGCEDAYFGRMKGIYRLTWAENQKNFRNLPRAIEALSKAGIPALLLKGAALTLICYRDFGLRGMGDLDVAVPVSRAVEAIEILKRLNWQAFLEFPKLQTDLHHAAHFKNARGEDLDLHWHILVHRCEERYDRPFWEGAKPVEYKGAEFLSLQPSDHLVHACLHGAAWSPSSPLRWIADAVFLIRRCEIDWKRVLEMGQILGVIPTLQVTLSYLKESFSAAVPTDFLSQLAALETPAWQQRELEVLCRPHLFLGILPVLWERHSRKCEEDGKGGRFRSFPTYLKRHYCLSGFGELGSVFLRKTTKKVMRGLRFRPAKA